MGDGEGADGNDAVERVLGSKVGTAVHRPGYSVQDVGRGVGPTVTRSGEYKPVGAGSSVSAGVFRVGLRVGVNDGCGVGIGVDILGFTVGALVGRGKSANAGGHVPRTSTRLVSSLHAVPRYCNLKPDFCTELSDRNLTRIVSEPTEIVSGMMRPVMEATTGAEIESPAWMFT